MRATYKFARCGRCKAQLEPAPFTTELGEDDWGHEKPYCWSAAEEAARLADLIAPGTLLFPVEHVELEYDGHTYKEVKDELS